jgi:hypothetical protein
MPRIVIEMDIRPAHGNKISPAAASTLPSKYPIPEIVTGKPNDSALIARIGRAKITPARKSKYRNILIESFPTLQKITRMRFSNISKI